VDTLRAAYTAAQLLGERGQEGAPSGADEFWTCVVQHSKPAFPEYEKRKEQAQVRVHQAAKTHDSIRESLKGGLSVWCRPGRRRQRSSGGSCMRAQSVGSTITWSRMCTGGEGLG
jgi:hypothetical protein